MINVLAVIDFLTRLIILLVFVKVFLSYFMDPFHPLRQTIDQIVEPMLAPIRQLVPPVGRFDFSPIILIILIELLSFILRNLLT
jgi:YggT family protein